MKHLFKASMIGLLAMLITFNTFLAKPLDTQAAEGLDIEAESAILIDANSGEILYAKQADLTLPPASMTKMMSEYLILDAIAAGDISWDTTTQVSDYAYSISSNTDFSGTGLTQNKDYTVRDLYNGMAINSDNAATIVLAELVGGSETEFVKMMNEKAEEIGMKDYKFVNSSGLSNSDLGDNRAEGTNINDENLMTAKSTGILAYNLIKDHPEALEVSSVTQTDFDGKQITNWNWMLPNMPGYLEAYGYEGMDGLKTGHTDVAGYCFTGTAERDGQRYITVIMKSASEEARFQETAKLLDYGFNQFEQAELYKAGTEIKDHASVPVAKGKEDSVAISTKDAVTTSVKNGEEDKYHLEYKVDKDKLDADGELVAPVKKGDKVGTATLVYDGDDQGNINGGSYTVDVVASEDVEKSNWFMLSLGAIGDFFAGIFTSVSDTVKGWF
ncbi:D-alanyl-D-alanine carboxypeptidase [Terribacillus saccharophilus]|uniref:serine-type D-Ala-D-Ala carboxypeptidase n=1 Tax=Terribacillus saccharophilus TaxID=361277 RepID=A0A075LMP1_9BACI|nr:MULTISPECIES: serine hydrolase [Terribacillus]AIF67232.1 D-alanyl-D-alanine carboxypeptidase [Terribacillus goriensis]MCM3227066.1 D-alanyl-D-alanine carboxypeptidase [Terribacillus saccharophilus]